jgi:hypothetical protein
MKQNLLQKLLQLQRPLRRRMKQSLLLKPRQPQRRLQLRMKRNLFQKLRRLRRRLLMKQSLLLKYRQLQRLLRLRSLNRISYQSRLFDPIVITVPKTDVSKTSEKQPTEESVATAAKNDADPLSRPRLAAASENEVPKQSCLVVSQETVSILSNGGNLGILVGANQDVDTEKITAKSNSPDDVLVGIEPEIGKQSRRVFFVIKSISEKKGVFSVLFSSPCGDKEIQVKVR